MSCNGVRVLWPLYLALPLDLGGHDPTGSYFPKAHLAVTRIVVLVRRKMIGPWGREKNKAWTDRPTSDRATGHFPHRCQDKSICDQIKPRCSTRASQRGSISRSGGGMAKCF